MRFKYPRLTVDGVLIKKGKILLVKRKNEPFKNKWALPGGFVKTGEKVEDSIIREVLEETGLRTRIVNFIGVYSDPNRDPRGHVVTLAYLIEKIGGKLKGGDDASDARFFDLNALPELAFDHDKIIRDALRRDNCVLSQM